MASRAGLVSLAPGTVPGKWPAHLVALGQRLLGNIMFTIKHGLQLLSAPSTRSVASYPSLVLLQLVALEFEAGVSSRSRHSSWRSSARKQESSTKGTGRSRRGTKEMREKKRNEGGKGRRRRGKTRRTTRLGNIESLGAARRDLHSLDCPVYAQSLSRAHREAVTCAVSLLAMRVLNTDRASQSSAARAIPHSNSTLVTRGTPLPPHVLEDGAVLRCNLGAGLGDAHLDEGGLPYAHCMYCGCVMVEESLVLLMETEMGTCFG